MPSVPIVSLRDVVSSGVFVGRAVRVIGRCLAPPSERPLGPFSSGLGEWQLESDGVAIYIVGQPPRVCAGLAGGAVVTVTGIVAEDTLPALGDLPPAPRRYLVQTVAQPD